MHIFQLFCNTCPYQSTPILFLQSSTIMINGSILILLLRVKNIHINQPLPPLNHLRMFLCYHTVYLDHGYFVKRKKMRDTFFFCPWRFTRRILLEKATNNSHYVYSNRYINIFPNRWHGIII